MATFSDEHMCRLYEKFILEYYRVHHPSLKANADQIHIYNNALALFNNKKDWPLYENGKWLNYINEQINQIPEDELREKGLKISQELYNKTQEIYNHYKDIADKYKDLDDRELGLLSKTNKEVKINLGIIFNIRNNKPMDKWLIEQAKEKYNKENNGNE